MGFQGVSKAFERVSEGVRSVIGVNVVLGAFQKITMRFQSLSRCVSDHERSMKCQAVLGTYRSVSGGLRTVPEVFKGFLGRNRDIAWGFGGFSNPYADLRGVPKGFQRNTGWFESISGGFRSVSWGFKEFKGVQLCSRCFPGDFHGASDDFKGVIRGF